MPSKNSISVIIIDECTFTRKGLKVTLEREDDIKECQEFESTSKAKNYLESSKSTPNVAIIDLNYKDNKNLNLIKYMSNYKPNIKVLVLSSLDESIYAAKALEAGARGFLPKSESPSQVLIAIAKIVRGNLALSEAIYLQLINQIYTPQTKYNDDSKLSKREQETLKLIKNGIKNAEIASELNISTKTVNTYKEKLKDKLGLRSTHQLIRFACNTSNALK